MKKARIPTYVVNLKRRVDRKEHILSEFSGKEEFDLNIVEAIEDPIGAVGLWKTILSILKKADADRDEFIVICEDDHQFTENYAPGIMDRVIAEALKIGADILCGGISSFKSAFQITDEIFWVEQFCGLQFTIIFGRFYKTILAADFRPGDSADLKISFLSNDTYFIHPFISTQKEFGYSDVTLKNNTKGWVNELFSKSAISVQILKYIEGFYKSIQEAPGREDLQNLVIPTYVINLPERNDRRDHIKRQFAGRPEFDITIVEAFRHENGAVGLWHSIRKVIAMALENDDDVIVLCEDDHIFTPAYSRNHLLQNIFLASRQKVDIILGGVSGFDKALVIPGDRFWVNSFFGTQFVIIFKQLFKPLLDEPFDDSVTADGILTELAANKIVLFPFISSQKGFGYSDVNEINNHAGHVEWLFEYASGRLEGIRREYGLKCKRQYITQV